MKKSFFQRFLVSLLLLVFAVAGGSFLVLTAQAKKPVPEPIPALSNAIIALDAGHGETDAAVGADGICGDTTVYEVGLNLAVRKELISALLKIEGVSMENIFEVPQLESRRDRVAEAEVAGADILISIHHNGSTVTDLDYTQTFITQKKIDLPLAEAIHPNLLSSLGLKDGGITSTGFGMTVFGEHPAVLTEAYFITKDDAACDYLDYLNGASDTQVEAEVNGLLNGIIEYFN